jgi:hypothetical protein
MFCIKENKQQQKKFEKTYGQGKNFPAPTGGCLHSQNCNFPEESFILSSSCKSVNPYHRYQKN